MSTHVSSHDRAPALRVLPILFTVMAIMVLITSAAHADGGVTYTDISATSGISYERTRSASYAGVDADRQSSYQSPLPPEHLFTMTSGHGSNGLPGVAVFDYDGDGDLDLYVTNGPGSANSLLMNQLSESGAVSFIDRANAAGVAATDQDSTGVCFGDIDNDGDHDLMVLGNLEANRLYENRGDGTFEHVAASGLEGGPFASTSCSMGDVDGDGYLDVAVANAFDYSSLTAIFLEPYALNHPNQLFRNEGNGSFTDISDSSGFLDHAGLASAPTPLPTITWAVAMVDIDQDGDTDIVTADDQGGMPVAVYGGLDRGFLHVFLNDGTGQLSDSPHMVNVQSSGSWMGLGFGDFNCDGHLDIFGSNFGDYNIPFLGLPYLVGDQQSRWLLGNGDGTFTEPGVGALQSTTFGWGSAVFDHDNDGDTDIIFHGGLDMNLFAFVDNPGTVLDNQGCSADFEARETALSVDHTRRLTHGVAAGDLDRDGFVDVVTTSSRNLSEATPLIPSPASYGSPYDDTALIGVQFFPTPEGFVWSGVDTLPGTVTVEIANGNSNGSVTALLVGGAGLVAGGASNRDGIGAVVSFTPQGGSTSTTPVVGGSSFLSQHAVEAYFGLGQVPKGTLEVLWPGGAKNRLEQVQEGESVTFPEIPCGFDADWASPAEYQSCVKGALDAYVAAGVLAAGEHGRFLASALQAYADAQ